MRYKINTEQSNILLLIKISRQSFVFFLFLSFPPSGNIAMFQVGRDLTVRSETNNTVQAPPPYPSDFHSSQNSRVIFLFDSAREQRYWCHVSCLSFLYSKRYDRFHLLKISHFLTYDNILVSWPLEIDIHDSRVQQRYPIRHSGALERFDIASSFYLALFTLPEDGTYVRGNQKKSSVTDILVLTSAPLPHSKKNESYNKLLRFMGATNVFWIGWLALLITPLQ